MSIRSIGIIEFPGTNGNFDALHYFEDSFFIWHKTHELSENVWKSLKLVVIPGGFSFGDRLYKQRRSSALANIQFYMQ